MSREECRPLGGTVFVIRWLRTISIVPHRFTLLRRLFVYHEWRASRRRVDGNDPQAIDRTDLGRCRAEILLSIPLLRVKVARMSGLAICLRWQIRGWGSSDDPGIIKRMTRSDDGSLLKVTKDTRYGY